MPLFQNKSFLKNPYFLFLPFLFLFIILVIVLPSSLQFGDQRRYLIYAQYMINGYLPESEKGFDLLGNGPGYSIFLIPFVYLKAPLIFITICNAVFYYFSIIMLFKTLLRYIPFSFALVLSLFWALYLNMYENLVYISPEIFSSFLIILFTYLITKSLHTKKINKTALLASLILGFLILTKPIFGYVLLTLIVGSLILYLLHRDKSRYKTIIFILLVALVSNLPYLVYTYGKTNKLFYWSSYGGNNLYWMSNPSPNEYGDWFRDPTATLFLSTEYDTSYFSPKKFIIQNHGHNFEIINKYIGSEQDDIYKKIAIKNIKQYPSKFLINFFSNAGRMFFNFPYSYTFQKPGTLLRLPLTGTLLVMILLSTIPAILNWRKIPFSARFLILFCLIYLGGTLFGSAEIRMFSLIVPIFLLWIGIILNRTIKLNINWNN